MAKSDLATTNQKMPDETSQYLTGSNVDEDPAAAIAARIVQGETEEEVFGGPQSLLSADQQLDRPFMLLDVQFRESDFENGPGAYAIFHCRFFDDPQGGIVLMTCGARNAMASAYRAKQLGWLPKAVKLVPAPKQTKAGYTPIWLTLVTEKEVEAAKSEASF